MQRKWRVSHGVGLNVREREKTTQLGHRKQELDMRILSSQEGKLWLSANADRVSEVDTASSLPFSVSYELPKDTGRKTMLARCLAELLVNRADESFLWITDWGAWPNLSNMDLFYGYRKSLGENRPLIEAPFHVFRQSDVEKFGSLLDLSLYFLWDSVLGASGWDVAVSTSHDETIEIHTRQASEINEITSALDGLELQQIR